jgi:hypothetical protein
MIQGTSLSQELARLNTEPGNQSNSPNPLVQTFQNAVSTLFPGPQSLAEKKIAQLEIEKNGYLRTIEQLIYQVECLEGLTKIENNSNLETELEKYKETSQNQIHRLWAECEEKGIHCSQMERDKVAAEIRYENLLKVVEEVENHKNFLLQDVEYWKTFAANTENEKVNLESNLRNLAEKCKSMEFEKLELQCNDLKKENEFAKKSIEFLIKKEEGINIQYEHTLSLCNNLDIQKNRINQQCQSLEKALEENQVKRAELQLIINRLNEKKSKLDNIIAISPQDVENVNNLFIELQQEYTIVNESYYRYIDQYECYKNDMINQMQNLRYTADYKTVLEERYSHFDKLAFKDKMLTACLTSAVALGGLTFTASIGPVVFGTSVVGFCTYQLLNLRTSGKKTILDNNYEKYIRQNPELTEFEIYERAKNERWGLFQEIKNGL